MLKPNRVKKYAGKDGVGGGGSQFLIQTLVSDMDHPSVLTQQISVTSAHVHMLAL